MIRKSLFLCCAAFALIAAPTVTPIAHAQNAAAPARKSALPAATNTKPLAEAAGQGVKIQLQRARWASGREVLLWPWMEKALTLWFDARLVPKQELPDGLSAADYIVNVRLIDEQGRAVEVWPIDTVRSLHRSSLPYVPIAPKLEPNGQSLWRAQGFDPNFKAVKIQIEWLKPGHPFTSKTIPDSLLKLEKGAPIPPAAAPWLQTLEMSLPTELIEIGALQEASATVAENENDDYQVALYRWQLGSTKIASDPPREFPTIQTDLVVTASTDEAAQKLAGQIMLIARNQSGETLKKVVFTSDSGRYFAPDGKPLRSNQRHFDVSLNFDEKPFEAAGPWSLEVRSYDKESSLVELANLPKPVVIERKTK